MELVETRKVAFSYVDRKLKRNGMCRKLNSVRMEFQQEEGGTDLYFEKTDNGFAFTREEKANAILRDVKYDRGHSKPQKYINMRGIVDEEGVYDIYKIADGHYQAYLNNEKAIKLARSRNADSALVRANNTIHIPKRISTFLRKNIQDPVFIIKEHYKPYCYIQVQCVERENADGINSLCNYYVMHRRQDGDDLTYKRQTFEEMTVSRFFMNFSGIKPGDTMYFDITGEHELVIEEERKKCAICGKEIRRRYDLSQKTCMCQKCSTVSGILERKLDFSGKDRQAVIKSLKQELMAVMEQLKEIGGIE